MSILGQVLSSTTAAISNLTENRVLLRDYQHAAKIFRPNNNSFAPKVKNWFHVFFELDPDALQAINNSLSLPTQNYRLNWDASNVPILGVLVKSAKLPNFTFEVRKNNQYNKLKLTTAKINYSTIDISFWDDTVDTIRTFWYAYYQYMIQDSKYVNWQYFQNKSGIDIPTQWTPSTANSSSLYSSSDNWQNTFGLDTSNRTSSSLPRTSPFFRSIRIFQFNRAIEESLGVQYSEYVLVNPMITGFDHDTNEFSSSEFMTNKMTVEYETVLYSAGLLNNDEIASWDAVTSRFFDNTPSPNGTPSNILPQYASILPTSSTAAPIVRQAPTSSNSVLSTPISSNTDVLASLSSSLGSSVSFPATIPGYGTSGNPPGE